MGGRFAWKTSSKISKTITKSNLWLCFWFSYNREELAYHEAHDLPDFGSHKTLDSTECSNHTEQIDDQR